MLYIVRYRTQAKTDWQCRLLSAAVIPSNYNVTNEADAQKERRKKELLAVN